MNSDAPRLKDGEDHTRAACRQLYGSLRRAVIAPYSPKIRMVIASVDQALSSLQNFALVVLVAREASPVGFGAFSLCLSILTFAIGIARATTSEPFMLEYAAIRDASAARTRAALPTVTVLLGMAIALILGIWGACSPTPLQGVLLASAVVLPGVLILDLARWIALTDGKPVALLAIDTSWVCVWVAALLIHPHNSPPTTLLVWGGAGTVVGATCVIIGRLRASSPAFAFKAWHANLHASARSLSGEFLATSTANQISTFLVSGIIGLGATAAIRGAQTLFGPVFTLQNAARISALPEIIRAGGGLSQRGKRINLLATGMQVMTAAVATGVLVALPGSLGRSVLGASWPEAHRLLLAVGVGSVLSSAVQYPLTRLRADGHLAVIARTRYVVSSVGLIIVCSAAFTHSVLITAWCLAAGNLYGWLGYTITDRRRRQAI
jgi:hypothetical protein